MAAASCTNTESSSSETPPELFEERAKAEQPRPSTPTDVKKMQSSFDEQNLPKPEPEPKARRVEAGSGETDSGETDPICGAHDMRQEE